ncbi:uncharacterized protein LOC132195104 [Neocloeon triangulifer]|uniref:uncharacterized protein LOC132195104 n=1 Tax=Neocloeon triangulifer TaxID=2078957 RepID=UPI00286F1611|nr:uncharacterized protein LOC132195104 [Neocloeon triangulifer]XP_059472842.1 uncharacterized protein LOC132195104 [Neocloeon triangulifer]XP_059472843.1 uncharacterized protein LOC132195104 [Neocloeon triangulifer]
MEGNDAELMRRARILQSRRNLDTLQNLCIKMIPKKLEYFSTTAGIDQLQKLKMIVSCDDQIAGGQTHPKIKILSHLFSQQSALDVHNYQNHHSFPKGLDEVTKGLIFDELDLFDMTICTAAANHEAPTRREKTKEIFKLLASKCPAKIKFLNSCETFHTEAREESSRTAVNPILVMIINMRRKLPPPEIPIGMKRQLKLMENLQCLQIPDFSFTDGDLKIISKLKLLQTLGLMLKDVTAPGIEFLTENLLLLKIFEFSARGSKLLAGDVAALLFKVKPSLKVVACRADLQYFGVELPIPTDLKTPIELEHFTTSEYVMGNRLAKVMPNLTHLKLLSPNVRKNGPNLKGLKNLSSVILDQFSPKCLKAVLNSVGSQLTQLILTQDGVVEQIKVDLHQFIMSCPALETLVLYFDIHLAAKPLLTSKGAPHALCLKKLDLHHLLSVPEHILTPVLRAPMLEYVSLTEIMVPESDCCAITSLVNERKILQNLRFLEIEAGGDELGEITDREDFEDYTETLAFMLKTIVSSCPKLARVRYDYPEWHNDDEMTDESINRELTPFINLVNSDQVGEAYFTPV